ncbi:MAG: Ig-like domain-containing protein [Lachnospiraceae bacterium]|nr:Ig-like domain-containing protein [Lachnospiraceae bacterium]
MKKRSLICRRIAAFLLVLLLAGGELCGSGFSVQAADPEDAELTEEDPEEAEQLEGTEEPDAGEELYDGSGEVNPSGIPTMLYVGNTNLVTARSMKVGDGELIYDASSCTLTMKNVSISQLYKKGQSEYYGIFCDGKLNIVVDGDCSIGGSAPGGATVIEGIHVDQLLSIKPASTSLSTLTVSVGGTSDGTATGISGGYAVTIADSATGMISVITTAASAKQDSYGLRAGRGLNMSSGTLVANGGSVLSRGRNSYGIYSKDGIFSVTGGSITAVGGSVKDSTAKSCGLYVAGDLKVSNGTLTLETASVSGDYFTESCALYVTKSTTISGGTVNATAGNAGSSAQSHGVYSTGLLTISGGKLNAKSGKASGESSVAVDAGTFSMSGGTLSAVAGDASKESYGLRLADKDSRETKITGGTITATGGNAATSYGIKVNTYLTLTGGKCTASGKTESISAAKPRTGTQEVTIKAPVFKCGDSASNAVTVKDYVYGSKYAVLDATIAVVLLNNWTYGDTPNSPSVMNLERYGNGSVTASYAYKKSGAEDSTYSSSVPSNAGDYVVRASLSNGIKATKSFRILQRDLSEVKATVTGGTYNGSEQTASCKLVYKERQLVAGTDYDVTGNKATNVENVTAKFTGKGNFKGTKQQKWSLSKAELKAEYFNLPGSVSLTYDGSGRSVARPTLKGTYSGCGNITLYYDGNTDNPVNAGSYAVTFDVAEGKNFKAAAGLNYGTMVVNKADNPLVVRNLTTVNGGRELDLNSAVQNAQGAVSFRIDGPQLGCSLNGSILKTGSATGSITVKATAAGDANHKASEELPITVTIRQLKYASLTVTMPSSVTYGDALPDPVYTTPSGGWVEGPVIRYTGRRANGEEYNESDDKPRDAGTYTVTVEGLTADTVYSGSAEFTIVQRPITGVKDFTVKNRPYTGDTWAEADYSGARLEGVLPVDNDLWFIVDAAFEDPAVGTGKKVVITNVDLDAPSASYALNNYVLADSCYTTEVTADILPYPLKITAEDQIVEAGTAVISSADKVSVEELDGFYHMPADHRLTAVSLSADTSAAGVSVPLTPSAAKITDAEGNDMTANYSFTYVAGEVSVVARSLESAVVSVEGAYTFGDKTEPENSEVKVTLDDVLLAYGSDYTLSFSGNDHAGTATVTVNGKGQYSGQAIGNYTIAPKELSDPVISVAKAAWTGSALEPNVELRDTDDRLINPMEYTLIYSNNVNVGTDTAVVTVLDREGGDYTVSGSKHFTIEKGAMRTLDTITRYISASDRSPRVSIASMLPLDAGNATGFDLWEEAIANGVHLTDYLVNAGGEIELEIASGVVSDWVMVSVWIKGENYDVNFWVKLIMSNLKNPEYTAPKAAALSYTGEEQALLIPGSVTKGGKLEYSEDMYEWSETIPVGIEVGEYTVYYHITSTDEYNSVEATPVYVRIRNAAYKLTVEKGEGSGEYEASERVTIRAEAAPAGQVFDSWVSEEELLFADQGASITTLTMPAQAVTVTATYKNDEKPQPVLKKEPVAKDLKYNWLSQVLIEPGVAEGGTLHYALGSSETKVPRETEFSSQLPKGKEPAYYFVWYYIKGDSTHGNTAPACITVIMKDKDGNMPERPSQGGGGEDSPLDPVVVVDNLTTELHLVKGQKFTIPKSLWSSKKSCGWKSSNKKILSISKKGSAAAKKATSEGSCVYLMNESLGKSIPVYIDVPAYSSKKALSLEAGAEDSIGFSCRDTELAVFYASSAPDVACVDQSGRVHAISRGTATVTAYVNGKAYNRKVKVTEKSVALTRTLHITRGESKKLSVKGLKKVQWEVESGTAVSFVKKNKLKADSVGTAVVYTTYKDTVYRIRVIVEDPAITTEGIAAARGKNKYTAALKVGDKKKIAFAGISFEDPERQIVFKSNKPSVAFVDTDGTLVVRGKGKARLTAKLNGKTITINVKAD